MNKLLDIIENSKTKLLKERIAELELELLGIKKSPEVEREKIFKNNIAKFFEIKNDLIEKLKAMGEINKNLSFGVESKNIEIRKLKLLISEKDNAIKQLKSVIKNNKKEKSNEG